MLSYGEMFAKIGVVDPEIIWLRIKKKEINARKKYIARLSSLPNGLN